MRPKPTLSGWPGFYAVCPLPGGLKGGSPAIRAHLQAPKHNIVISTQTTSGLFSQNAAVMQGQQFRP